MDKSLNIQPKELQNLVKKIRVNLESGGNPTNKKEELEYKLLKDFEDEIAEEQQERDKMVIKAGGRRTVPQIFINDKHIGGCDDLYA